MQSKLPTANLVRTDKFYSFLEIHRDILSRVCAKRVF